MFELDVYIEVIAAPLALASMFFELDNLRDDASITSSKVINAGDDKVCKSCCRSAFMGPPGNFSGQGIATHFNPLLRAGPAIQGSAKTACNFGVLLWCLAARFLLETLLESGTMQTTCC